MKQAGLARHLGRHADKLRFAGVGASAFVVGALCLEFLGRAGVPQIAAQVPTLAICVTYTWLCNRRWTFGIKAAPSWAEYVSYVLMSAGGLLINALCFSALTFLGTASLPAFAVSTLAAMGFNFAGYKFTVFRDR